jgi:hypothetical protein
MVGLHLHLLRIGNGMPLPSRLYASAGIPTHARSLLTAVAPEPQRKAGGKVQAGGRRPSLTALFCLPQSPPPGLWGAVENARDRRVGVFQGLREDGGEEAEDASFPQTGSFHSPGRDSTPGLSEKVIHPQILRKTQKYLMIT